METPAVKAQRLLEEIYRQRKGAVDVVPEGYMSVAQYAKLWKMGRTNTEKIIKEAVKKKLVKTIRLRQLAGGRLMKLNFYG
jgi:Fic family protein